MNVLIRKKSPLCTVERNQLKVRTLLIAVGRGYSYLHLLFITVINLSSVANNSYVLAYRLLVNCLLITLFFRELKIRVQALPLRTKVIIFTGVEDTGLQSTFFQAPNSSILL